MNGRIPQEYREWSQTANGHHSLERGEYEENEWCCLATVQRTAAQQLGHVITCVSDIENTRRATAADQIPLPPLVYTVQIVPAHLDLATHGRNAAHSSACPLR